MAQTLTHLSNQAVYSLTKQNPDSQPIFVQVIEFQAKKDKHYIIVSDGFHMIKALPKDQNILNPSTDINSIISIKRHMMGGNNVVGILEFEKVFNYKSKIGDPQQFNSDSINPESIQTLKLQKSLVQLKIEHCQNEQTAPKLQQTNEAPITIKKQTFPPNRTFETQNKMFSSSISKPLNGNLKDYETIKQLWVGMDRWTIVCRVVKVAFDQFTSRKSGKDTKVLNVELMDRTGMKISGAFFGDAADKFKDYLVKDRVYKISQGQIRQESYNNSKNQKVSPYKLVFTVLSTFEEVSDTNSIAKNEDSAITLGDCLDRRTFGQQFDIVCILINIEDTVEVKKEDKILRKTNLLVADPIKNLTLHAVVWQDKLIPSRQLIGKTVILSRFKLNEYKGSLNLSSIYRSSIIPTESHSYQQFEKQVMNQYTSYEKLHQFKHTGYQNNDVCTTIRQLQQKIERLEYDEWARSDLTIFINRFALKKWHYDGCPHCSKAAQSLNNCPHCNKYVEKTVGHFIMGVQICDYTGSMWTVAYDEWAKKIFNVADQTTVIDFLLKLQANQLKQETQVFLYQQFKLRISSKKDNQGRIKHNVSKVYDRNLTEQTFKNIQLINKLSIE